ncbi:uracil nucleotide/cysteinyl leukotriene receptor [Nematolebias whitei]|uniref:uracil nucleotide/cysteinyl leukotriene receptor n=1 Tax=Nematolebias whitei TaxID=451745 RepID=UPI0018996BF1|nr:uracil nucleotide/cysteinyl leukotriene receptor [Nematolebias whitei]
MLKLIVISTTINLSIEEYSKKAPMALWDISLSIFYILVFIIAVPGNALALWAFFQDKSTSSFKVFLRNLSIADISYVLILPMRIVYHLSDGYWPFGSILCQVSFFLFYLNMYCSLFLMSLISLDRFLAIVLPLRSQKIRKPLNAKISLVILWVIVTVSMSPSLFSKKNHDNSTVVCSMLYLQKTSPNALISTAVAFLIPFITIIISCVLILLKLRKLKQQEGRPIKAKAIQMIILILMNFLFAFVPYHVCRIIYTQSQSLEQVATMNRSLERANQITSALTCISGALDPVMYFFLNRAYRKTFFKLFYKNRNHGL